MTRMARFAESQMKERLARLAQQEFNGPAAFHKRSMRAPGGDDILRPMGRFDDRRVIGGANRILGRAHCFWIRIPPGKNICDAKAPIAQGPRAALAAFNGWIVLNFRRG